MKHCLTERKKERKKERRKKTVKHADQDLGKNGMVVGCYSVYSSSLPVAHLSDVHKRLLVVTGDSARVQDETTESFAWFFYILGV